MNPTEGGPIESWQLEFQYTYDDLREARQAHANRGKKRARPAMRPSVVLFLALAVMLFFVLQGNGKHGARTPSPPKSAAELYDQFKPLVWIAGFGVAWLVIYVWARGVGRRQFDREPAWHAAQRVGVTAAGVTHANATAKTEYSWDAFRKLGESESLFLLYTGEAFFVIVPKRAFHDAADADAFREFCQRSISPPQRAFPVLPPKG